MEEAILEDLLEVGVEQDPGHFLAINPCGFNRIVVSDLDGVDVLERQDPARGVSPDDVRDSDAPAFREIGRKAFGIPAFLQVVDLPMHDARKLLD